LLAIKDLRWQAVLYLDSSQTLSLQEGHPKL
jgi:hypothetical protein